MEYFNFHKFCTELEVSRENNGGALGQKLQKLDPKNRVSCVYNLFGPENICTPLDMFPPNHLPEIQSHENCMKDYFEAQNDLAVLQIATLIIQASKPSTTQARNAYSHRAISLFKLNRYHESLYDVNRAMHEHWAEKLRDNLICFKSLCMDFLLNDRGLEEESKTFKYKINADDLDPNYEECFELPKIENPHEWIRNGSKKIEIQFSPEFGRFLVAAEDIAPGELLFVDKPYAYALGNNCQITNCSHCFMRCVSLIPCPNCKTSFCSDSCRAQAFLQYHRMECQIMNNVKSEVLDMESRLALRILMIATRQGKDVKKLSEHPLYKNPFDSIVRPIDKRNFEEDYYHIHHLQSHDKELKNYDLVHFCFKASVLIELLRWTTFFERSGNVIAEVREPHSLTREQLFVSSLLLRYLSIIKFNGIMIRDRVERPEELKQGPFFFDVLQTGLAIYPISSLLNHSCNSNSLLVSFKTSCACYATQPILKGNQIFINYECHYLIHPLEYRIKRLEDVYYFKCKCRPCEERWPGMKSNPKLQRTSARLSKEEMRHYKNKMEQLVTLPNVKEKYKLEQIIFLRDLMMKFLANTKQPNVTYENAMSLLSNILVSKGNNYELVDNSVLCKYRFSESFDQKIGDDYV